MGKITTITNDVTTGSMYGVTLDSQSITASELQLGFNKFKVDESVTGTIYVFTERKPCLSCEGVINKFKEMFPNIKLFIIYQYD